MTYILIGGLILAIILLAIGMIIQAKYIRKIESDKLHERLNHVTHTSGYSNRRGYTPPYIR